MALENKKSKGRRGARVAASASQFSLNVSYSNRARAHGSPASCVEKLKYDFQFNSPGISRVSYRYVSSSEEHTEIAKNPIAFAKACERSAGRQSNCRQMKHVMVALPAEELSDRGRRQLAIRICNLVRQLFEDQPVFAAIHCPSEGEKNFHLHLSHGLRKIHMRSATTYDLGDRILSEQRPKIRTAAGLPATNHGELRTLRANIAEAIANSLAEESADPQLVERWRCGHLTLTQQVRSAATREDWQFVRDNAFRDPTQHEGYAGLPSGGSAESHLKSLNRISNSLPSSSVGPKALTREIVALVLTVAKRREIRRFEFLRMLALDHDLIIRVTRRKRRNGSRGAVAGLSFQLIGGPTFLGRSLDFQLHRVCEIVGIKRSNIELCHEEFNLPDKYLTNFPGNENELCKKFQGRITAAVLLYILVRKTNLVSPEDQFSTLDRSQEEHSLDATIERGDLIGIIEELRCPLSAAERDLRDSMILRDLDEDDYLREYVYRDHAISKHANRSFPSEGDAISGGQTSRAECGSDITDQNIQLSSTSPFLQDRRYRSSLT